jgi:hypothetical protein
VKLASLYLPTCRGRRGQAIHWCDTPLAIRLDFVDAAANRRGSSGLHGELAGIAQPPGVPMVAEIVADIVT